MLANPRFKVILERFAIRHKLIQSEGDKTGCHHSSYNNQNRINIDKSYRISTADNGDNNYERAWKLTYQGVSIDTYATLRSCCSAAAYETALLYP